MSTEPKQRGLLEGGTPEEQRAFFQRPSLASNAVPDSGYETRPETMRCSRCRSYPPLMFLGPGGIRLCPSCAKADPRGRDFDPDLVQVVPEDDEPPVGFRLENTIGYALDEPETD